mmetsp:Transcript_21160/g.29916  ORF Transcript_21160/g.29916 Transcript_21160/m.29916 type:complete len:311 (-) Transcript_21160:31-963(-)
MKVTLPLFFVCYCSTASAWTSSIPTTSSSTSLLRKQSPVCLHATKHNDDISSLTTTRRNFFAAVAVGSTILVPNGANALVKGNAPPPKAKAMGDKPKCTNVEECQAMAEKKAQEEREEEEKNMVPPEVTKSGVKYRDMEVGTSDTVVKDGDEVTIYFKVLKLGKRSFDGLSGEGTVVFSRGYGLEDDEKTAGEKAFVTTVGSPQNIMALNDALVGMKVGTLRRFSILPQQGWEKATRTCDGGPGGSGAGGELKTDYVVVPTATMVATEECFDKTKLPFPTTYAQQRRMAQRFDQSLIMEVQVIKTGPSPF